MIPAEWGVEAWTTSELAKCLAHVEEQLAGELSDRDRERLTERKAAVLAEQEERRVIAARPLGAPRPPRPDVIRVMREGTTEEQVAAGLVEVYED